jgi:predicted aconitase
MGFKTTGVNSCKAAHYLPGFCGQKVVLRDMDTLIQGAIK